MAKYSNCPTPVCTVSEKKPEAIFLLYTFFTEQGGAAIRRWESVNLGDDLHHLRKLSKVIAERLAWLEEHRRFAGSQSARKMDELRQYLKLRTKNTVVQNVLTIVDGEPISKPTLSIT